MPTDKLLDAIAVTAELTATSLSAPAARLMADDLSKYPEHQVLGALTRCRRELKGRLTIADVLTRLEDGRPGVEEAWAMLPKSEDETVVWTEEMARAMGVAQTLLDDGDHVAARMAFKESYSRLVQMARDASRPVRWTASLGHSVQGREHAIAQAVEQGKLTAEHAAGLLPYREFTPEGNAVLAKLGAVKMLEAK